MLQRQIKTLLLRHSTELKHNKGKEMYVLKEWMLFHQNETSLKLPSFRVEEEGLIVTFDICVSCSTHSFTDNK